jgi:hypothetical protein
MDVMGELGVGVGMMREKCGEEEERKPSLLRAKRWSIFAYPCHGQGIFRNAKTIVLFIHSIISLPWAEGVYLSAYTSSV